MLIVPNTSDVASFAIICCDIRNICNNRIILVSMTTESIGDQCTGLQMF